MSSNVSLEDIIAAYLEDSSEQQRFAKLAEDRQPTFVILRRTIYEFTSGQTDFDTFRERLDHALRPATVWYAQGSGFMMELKKFGKNHNDSSQIPANQFCELLDGLQASNVGQRIEECHRFFIRERERLHKADMPPGKIVAPGNSAFIISLFAFWLDPTSGMVVCSDGIRRGIRALIKSELMPELPDLKITPQTIEISTAIHYRAFQAANTWLSEVTPRLHTAHSGPYWSEFFFYWYLDQRHSAKAEQSTVIKESDDTKLLATLPTNPKVEGNDKSYLTIIGEAHRTKTNLPPDKASLLFTPEPLQPTPEPLLTRLIHEVPRYILVDEAVVRRIYHALLAGHVILTGPPGTGKTELARIIPEILWQSEKTDQTQASEADDDDFASERTSETAYTTRLVTATDEWTPRTLISSIAPQSKDGGISYHIQFGYLTSAIQKNWSFLGENPAEWSRLTLLRTRLKAASSLDRSTIKTFKGLWLVIDEFNRAPIDQALGDALSALGGNGVLRVGIEGGSAELPIPQDFRIIGTLNSFDRNYLNQISEALKRRFSFIEILPPTRQRREAEQNIVLYKALRKISHLTPAITGEEDTLYWSDVVTISAEPEGEYSLIWDDESHPFRMAFETAWRILEVVRIYRQLGTAQAISLVQHMLIAGILQSYTTQEQWIAQALDAALCDTIADQLQVLLPDEIETLQLHLTVPADSFAVAYNSMLDRLASLPQRIYGQLFSLASIVHTDGQPLLSDSEADRIANQDRPAISVDILSEAFHLEHPHDPLPQFARRLRSFKIGRGL